MRFSKAWIVAAKDIKVLLRHRYGLYSLILFPLIVGIGLPLVLRFIASRAAGGQVVAGARLNDVMNAFAFFFAIGASILPTTLASYSLVGEKVEKSLEPLLATPITDAELFLGKSIASFLPPVGALWGSSLVFMALTDLVTYSYLGHAYFPNWAIAVILLLVAPFAAALSIEVNVIISSRANDPRAAQMEGMLMVIPFAAIYVATEVGAFSLNIPALLVIAAVLLGIDVAVFPVSTRIFQREEILTRWT